MGILALAADERVADIDVTEDELTVQLMDGRKISVPLVWYPRLLNATAAQRSKWRISSGGYGIHWEEIDEDLSTEGLLRGAPAPRQVPLPAKYSKLRNTDEEPNGEIVSNGTELAVERGILDDLIEGEEAVGELNTILTLIQRETERIGTKINQHSSNLKRLNKQSGNTKPKDYRRLILLAAADMNSFAKTVGKSLPSLEKNIGVLNRSYSVYVSRAKPESAEDVKGISNLRNSLTQMLNIIGRTKQSTMEFRDSTNTIGDQNISSELTNAAHRQAQTINEIVTNIEETESFALRITFLIDQKFGPKDIQKE